MSTRADIFSVGQLVAETIGRPGGGPNVFVYLREKIQFRCFSSVTLEFVGQTFS